MSWSSWDRYPRYTRSSPIATEDGIRARKASKDFATTWWARRWIAALNAFGWSGRLSRGRSYARSGQVLDYQVDAGEVRARVQGSRRTPYTVSIRLRHLEADEWEAVLDAMSDRADFVALLLAGTMPDDIEQAFEAAGAALLPRISKDLTTTCSCPDWANPCKHVAAVHYILGEAFDEDPFLLFRLRGRTGEQVLEELRERRAGPPSSEEEAAVGAEPLPGDTASFWGTPAEPLDLDYSSPALEGAVLAGRGAPGGWMTEERLRKTLGQALRDVGLSARRVLEGELLEPPAKPRSRPRRAAAAPPTFEEWSALALAAEGVLNGVRLADLTGESVPRSRERLQEMTGAGHLQQEGRGRGTRYRLTAAGRRWLEG